MQVLTLLDATGSMAGNESRVVDGFREYLKVLSENEDTADAEVTLATFNSETRVRFLRSGDAAKSCRPLDWGEYRCTAVTPLYDAIAEAVGALERRAAEGEKVVFVINTDGLENASMRETRESIFNLIEGKKAAGWQFVFLGADLDAWAAKDQMGMTNIGLAASYNSADMCGTMRQMASNTVAYASCGDAASLMDGFEDGISPGNVPRYSRSLAAVNPTLTPDQAAALVGTTPVQLAKLRQQGKGPSYARLGHKTVRYTKRDVEDWLEAAKTTTSS